MCIRELLSSTLDNFPYGIAAIFGLSASWHFEASRVWRASACGRLRIQHEQCFLLESEGPPA
jgi:hypothetical protein